METRNRESGIRDQGSGMVTRLRRRRAGAVTIGVLLMLPLPGCMRPSLESPTEASRPGLLPALAAPMNLDFESPYTTHQAYWWDPGGGPYATEFGEVNVAMNWAADWYEGFQCPGTPFWQTGRPEVRLITTAIDAGRVRSGEQALKLFTFHRCHTAGVHQRFSVVAGQTYRLTAYAHSWYSNCSTEPHYTGCALDWDCESCVATDHDLRVGLDPAGGIDPYDAGVVWSSAHRIYGAYAEPLVVIARATGDTMTAHLFGTAPLPLRHNDDYWDGVRVERVWVSYWPLVMKWEDQWVR